VDTAWTCEKGKRNRWMKAVFDEIVQTGEWQVREEKNGKWEFDITNRPNQI
jgi:hypothetical protein